MQRSGCCRALWRVMGSGHPEGGIAYPLLFAAHGLRHKKSTVQVILTQDVERLGRAGDTVAVAPGYFRNYLMPKLLAVPDLHKYRVVAKDLLKLRPQTEEVKEEEESDDTKAVEAKLDEYKKAAYILANSRLSLWKFIESEDELQSAVTKEELVKEVARQLRVSIQPENLNLPAPLTSLGEFEVPLRIPRQIPLPEGAHSWNLRVKIRRR